MPVKYNSFIDGSWPAQFYRVLQRFPAAQQSLEILVRAGGREEFLLWSLYRYTHPASAKRLASFRSWSSATAKCLAKAEKSLRTAAKQLGSGFEDFQMVLMSWQSFREKQTLQSLLEAAKQAQELSKHYKQVCSHKGKGRAEETLVNLCLYIERWTARPHWGDIAYLLEAASSTFDRVEHWDQDSLRKVVRRFAKTYPELYKSMKDFVSETQEPIGEIGRGRPTRNRRYRSPKTRPLILAPDPFQHQGSTLAELLK